MGIYIKTVLAAHSTVLHPPCSTLSSSPWLPVPWQPPSRCPMCTRRSLQSLMSMWRSLQSHTMVENLQDMLDLPGVVPVLTILAREFLAGSEEWERIRSCAESRNRLASNAES